MVVLEGQPEEEEEGQRTWHWLGLQTIPVCAYTPASSWYSFFPAS